MSAGAILGGASIGAGVGVSSVALAPFNAANTFMGSAFFGYGMILGERYMYQADWPKIQARLEHGEKIENIIQEYTGVFTAVVMKEAKIIFDTVTREFIRIMQEALAGTVPPGPTIRDDAPTIGDPRRPKSPAVIKEEIKKEAEIIKTPTSIIKEAFEKTGTTTTTGPFIPPIISITNVNSVSISKAIGRIRKKVIDIVVFPLEINLGGGKWRLIKSLSNRSIAMTHAALAWPSPNYYPSFRNNNNDVYYFRIQ